MINIYKRILICLTIVLCYVNVICNYSVLYYLFSYSRDFEHKIFTLKNLQTEKEYPHLPPEEYNCTTSLF